jgi:lipopolysaccharide/colanic/teichoic acid biosynthesis glycosyltransferase
MALKSPREALFLLAGDLFFLVFALWAALLVRSLETPSHELFLQHLIPFSFIFCIWVLVFFAADLYGKHTVVFRQELPAVLLNAQLANSIVAIAFFYFVPYFVVTPKVVLFTDLAFSLALIFLWRVILFPLTGVQKRKSGMLIGTGREVDELKHEVNSNPRYDLTFSVVLDPANFSGGLSGRDIAATIRAKNIAVVVIDTYDAKVASALPELYKLIFSGVRFMDIQSAYEDIFDRIPLSLLRYDWFLGNISTSRKTMYDFLKRVIDIILSFFLGIIFLAVLPFVALAIKLEDGGSVFIAQERIGERNKRFQGYKFRSMEKNDKGAWLLGSTNHVTKVGAFLRKTTIDELPQIWNVFRGEMSLIGPRPDISGLGERLAAEIPFYNIRNIIKPGLSGWAQVKQRYAMGNISPQSVEESNIRLAYDLFYIKNRSLVLDLSIVLRTLKTLLARFGIHIQMRYYSLPRQKHT